MNTQKLLHKGILYGFCCVWRLAYCRRKKLGILEVLIVMALGVLIGATVFPEWLKSINEKCTLVSTVFLIFTMGVMLGSRDSFLDELVTLGLSSILFCIVPVICSIICVYVLTRLCMKDIIARHEHDAQTKDDS